MYLRTVPSSTRHIVLTINEDISSRLPRDSTMILHRMSRKLPMTCARYLEWVLRWPSSLCKLPGTCTSVHHSRSTVSEPHYIRNLGIGVDVHVHRITNRLGWHKPPTKNPEETRYMSELLNTARSFSCRVLDLTCNHGFLSNYIPRLTTCSSVSAR